MRKMKFLLISLLLLAPLASLAQWDPGNYADTGLPAGSAYDIVRILMMWILAIFGFIGIIGFVISGIMYLTSAGSDTQIEKAKAAMKWSIVGIVVGLVGLVIIFAIDSALNAMNYF